MKITLAYLIPIDAWKTYGASAVRFAETYRRFPAEVDHELLIMCCNGPATDEIKTVFEGIPARFESYYGGGWDCGAAQDTARRVDCDFLVCANSRVYFSRAGWLKRMAEARLEHGEGLYGATASFESFPWIQGGFSPHIRTSFYGCNPKAFREFPHTINCREDCFKFESGAWNFTRWFETRGERAMMVTWDGCYDKKDFRKPANIFRRGDQSNLIINDRHTEIYDLATLRQRVEMERGADGGVEPIASYIREAMSQAARKAIREEGDPLVSIGLAVYNGENYLTGALKALLAQEYKNFELIISDNASTDGTEAICRKFTKQDQRIRYIRQPENIGSPKNFAFVAQEAKGEYFMWAAHDDLFHPSYIRKCLARLREHPDAVLCCTEIAFIDAEGRPHPYWSKQNYKNIETLGMTPPQRIHEVINRLNWFAFYGLMRRESLQQISLGLSVYGFDVILIEELLLLGDFVKIHEPLFSYRMLKSKSAEDYKVDFNAEKAAKTPYTEMAVNLLKAVYASQLTIEQKLEIMGDFLVTLTRTNRGWRNEITNEMREYIQLDDAAFALLLASILSRAVPLETMRSNPLIRALCHGATAGTELLSVADALCARSGVSFHQGEAHKEALRLFEHQQFEESSKFFGEALKQLESSDLWCDWATTRLACHQPLDAESGFRRALDLDPTKDLAALKLGVLLASMDRHLEALPFLERYVTRTNEPDHGEVQQLLASCQSRLAEVPVI